MAAGPYLRAAASQLRQAAGDLQQQINQIQHDADLRARELNSAVIDHEKQKTDLMARQQLGEHDPNQHMTMELEIHRHDDEIKKLKEEVNQHSSKASGSVQGKINAMNSLNSKAAELESMAGSPDMN